MTKNRINVNELVVTASATEQDIEALTAPIQRLIRVDEATGERYVDEEDQHFIIGALWAVAERRQEARVATADEALTKAYGALLVHPKMPQTAPQRLVWESTMLRLFGDTADALRELVDAKVDAKTMGPARADRIRREAETLQHTAETNVRAALRKALRVARAH